MRHYDGRSEQSCDQPNETAPADLDTDRRALMGLAATGFASALLGMTTTPANATSGIGIVGSAQAQAGPAPVAPWWPSKFGKDDQIARPT